MIEPGARNADRLVADQPISNKGNPINIRFKTLHETIKIIGNQHVGRVGFQNETVTIEVQYHVDITSTHHKIYLMNFNDFKASKQELPLDDKTTAICYVDTHLANIAEERVWINRDKSGLLTLQIENQHYKGTLDELEKILWDWWCQD